MEQKYKVKDLAKDLGVGANDITDIVEEYFGTQKKAQASLNEEEVSVVMEKLTQKNQVKGFDEYFATAGKPKEEKKPEKKKAEKKADIKEEKKEAAKEEKPAEEVHEKVKESETQEKKSLVEEKKPVQAETKPEAKAETKPAKQDRPKSDKEGKKFDKDKPKFDKDGKKFDKDGKKFDKDGKKFDKDGKKFDKDGKKFDKDKKFEKKPARDEKPAAPVIDLANIKTNAPPTKHVKGEAVKRGEQVTKHVDTRGSYVDLDKYNERYESMAADETNRRGGDNYSQKQKIKQKSQKNKQQQFSKKKETEAQKLKRLELEKARKKQLEVEIPDEIVVSELASRLKVTAAEVIKKLFGLGVMATINETIDFDTAALVAEELGAKVSKEVVITIEERLFEEIEDNDENLKPRPPVVVVMGHVDHGKTSLLDHIRHANVTASEAGGITQHIGAYRVKMNDRDITFLDTPGHEAFTAMRARGALATDIAILVVAADDGIMPQTVEAINHARAANLQIIVAINKIDKPGANPEKVKQELTEHGLVCEEWGGDIICVPVSAKTGEGMDDLLEMVNLTADVMELKANPDRLAVGTVIEARIDKGRGPVATVLVQKGTLHSGDVIIAGTALGRVRVMRDDKGKVVKEAGPSVPVEIMGLSEVPSAGDDFAVVEDERLARELVEKRKFDAKEEQFKLYKKVSLDNLFSQIEEGSMKKLPIIVKADVQGSVEAVSQSLMKLSNDEVKVEIIHGAVGAVTESDVMLANASDAIIVGFNVRPHPAAAENAKRDGVDIRLYRVIYDAIEEVQTAMKGMLAPKYREVDTGRVEVRQVMKLSSVGVVAGSYVLDGKVQRSGEVRIVRDGIIVAVDKIAGLRRFKDDVKEVAAGYECGITLEKFTDIKEGDIFEAFVVEEYRD